MSDNCYNEEESKAESREQKKFDPKERKAMKTAELITIVFPLFHGLYALLNRFLENKGTHVLFIFGGFAITVAVIAVLYTVLFFKSIIKIKAYRTYFIIWCILIVLFAVNYIFICADYIKDIFGSTKTVITRDYYCTLKEPFYFCFMDENGEYHDIKISAETRRELENNPNSDEVSKNSYRYLKKNYITVEFYPNSMVLVRVDTE